MDGVYEISCQSDFSATTAVFDSCGGNELVFTYDWDGPLYLNAKTVNNYLVRIAGEDYGIGGTGSYTLTVTYYGPPVENDLCEESIVVDPNTTISGTTVGATGQDITEKAHYDAYDVWCHGARQNQPVWARSKPASKLSSCIHHLSCFWQVLLSLSALFFARFLIFPFLAARSFSL